MNERQAPPPRSRSRQLDSRYGADYFFGKTSGYPESGYADAHPDWEPWLDLIQQIVPRGRLLDLGCAYGYLVGSAQRRGFAGCGADISSFALSQEPETAGRLLQADLAALPFGDACGDVVCLFDVLEHLEDPLAALDEAVRVLAPEGLLAGATPDPLFFEVQEETHVCERPPSFWVGALRERGLAVRFRFSVQAYNFQFLAAHAGSGTAGRLALFQHDYFEAAPDFVRCRGPLEALPRQGWGSLREESRRLARSPASLYLLNSGPAPLACRASLGLRHPGEFATLRFRLGSLVLAEARLDSEVTAHRLELPEFLLPAGGHHLVFELTTPGSPEVFLGPLEFESRKAEAAQLTETLPFDLYQRYRFAAQAAGVLAPDSVLDVGGFLGDAEGHLATTADFLSGPNGPAVHTTDLRQGDFPGHLPAPAWRQPFAGGSFDLVLSLDLLEHLPPERRPDFLAELDRVARRWILLGAPRGAPEVDRAEEELSRGLMQSRAFLSEHRELGLPRPADVESFFERLGYQVLSFPNGFLPRWVALQGLTQFFFGLDDAGLFLEFNRLCNRGVYPHDLRSPAYRTVWVIAKQPLPAPQEEALQGLLSSGEDPGLEELLLRQAAFLGLEQQALALFERRQRSLRDTQFLINERQKLAGLQSREISALREELEHTPLWRLARRRWRRRRGRD